MRKLFLLIGPTCAGKSTLEKELNRRGIPSVTSYTTRARRTGEVDGVDYHFITRAQVEELDAAGQIVQRVDFAGNYYGSTLSAIDKAFSESDAAVIVVEPTGLTQFLEYAARTKAFTVISIYVSGNLQTLVTRLMDRYRADKNANAAYYLERLAGLVEQHHTWPQYADSWTVFIPEIDDADPTRTVASTAEFIMGTFIR